MDQAPIVPIPGQGRYIRPSLYVEDFYDMTISCLQNDVRCSSWNISEQDEITYIDIIREIKLAKRSSTRIDPVPYTLFAHSLQMTNRFNRNPPFTVQQLARLSIGEKFESTA